jgi:murein DD-endopeptidase MepM/ murein hydrolase activator NlpD
VHDPFSKKLLQRIDKSSSPAHISKLQIAVDFIAPKGTPLLAVADGFVTYTMMISILDLVASRGFYTNFIVIRHSNGEYSRYDHLDYKSSKVELNQKVHAGEEISKVGMTGYTYTPHLYFQVYVYTGYNVWTDFKTIEIENFRNIL